MMSDLNNLPEDVKRDLLRLMVLLNEVDAIKEEYPDTPRVLNIQNTIDVLENRTRNIRRQFEKDRESKK
jgi:hypothetical protein